MEERHEQPGDLPAYLQLFFAVLATLSFLLAHFHIGDSSVFWLGVFFNFMVIFELAKRN